MPTNVTYYCVFALNAFFAVDIAEALFSKVLLKMLQFLETVNASNKLIVRMGKARLD